MVMVFSKLEFKNRRYIEAKIYASMYPCTQLIMPFTWLRNIIKVNAIYSVSQGRIQYKNLVTLNKIFLR
jgi:hypothetical protein